MDQGLRLQPDRQHRGACELGGQQHDDGVELGAYRGPAASADLGHARRLHPQGCNNGCYLFVVNWQDTNLGDVQVRCMRSDMNRGGSIQFGSAYTVSMNGAGSKQLGCWLGADGYDVWIDVVGWGGSVDTEKRDWPRRQ